LRRDGVIPANVFGKDIKSVAVQVALADFQKGFKEAGETALVDVTLGSEVMPSLIHNLQRDPKSGSLLHVDFHKVNLKEKITTSVPVVLEGESPAAKAGTGLLLQTLNEVEVECLPTEIPAHFSIDAEKLTEIGQSVHVKDLKTPDGVTITNDPEETIVAVQTAEMKEEEPEPEVAPEDVEATAEKGEAEGEEIEASEGGETKAETAPEKPQE
jgi:large subunit ribosomal protein L25